MDHERYDLDPAPTKEASGDGAETEAPTVLERNAEPAATVESLAADLARFRTEFSKGLRAADPDSRRKLLTELILTYHKWEAEFEPKPERGINVDFTAVLKPLQNPSSVEGLIREYAVMKPDHFAFVFRKPLAQTIGALETLVKNPANTQALDQLPKLPTVRGFRQVIEELLAREKGIPPASEDAPTRYPNAAS